jgi:hypothetical protein
MITPTDATILPKYLAYFDVFVSVDYADASTEKAEGVVLRYLYGGFSLTGSTSLTEDNSQFIVQVRAQTDRSADDLKFRIQTQRDRLLSGMHASSDPVFYGPMGV